MSSNQLLQSPPEPSLHASPVAEPLGSPATTPVNSERFSSLDVLRKEHARLLEARRHHPSENLSNDTNSNGTANSADLLKQISEFVARGAATGALIDDEASRRATQSMLDYWANVLYRADCECPEPSLAEFDVTLAPDLENKECPYLGLQAFREENHQIFFGRERLVSDLLKRLKLERLLALVGASGSGKSSIVFGGLLPALRAGPGQEWRYLMLVPGAEPLVNLSRVASALAAQTALTPAQAASHTFAAAGFRDTPNYLAQLAADLGEQPVVLVVDQFEETFTLCADDAARRAFINQLIGLIQAPAPHHIVILTMRADFADNVAKLPNFQQLFEQARVDVSALGIQELRHAIERPAEQIGLKFEDGIVDDLVSTILGEQAGLPLLQFTLLKLWEQRNRNRITWEIYDRVGNPRVALGKSAEAFHTSLLPEDQTTLRSILLKMVRPGDGQETTSNRVPLADLFLIGQAKDRVERVLRKLIFTEHLVKLSGVPTPLDPNVSLLALTERTGTGNSPTLADTTIAQAEIAHEALVRNWRRLVEWVDEDRRALLVRRRLTDRAREWNDKARDPAAILRGRLLEEAEQYKDLNELEGEYVRTSRKIVDAELRVKEEAQARELAQAKSLAAEQHQRAEEQRLRAEEQSQRAREQTRVNHRLWGLVAALTAVSLVAFGTMGWALAERRAALNAVTAQKTAELASTRAIEGKSTAQADTAKSLAEDALKQLHVGQNTLALRTALSAVNASPTGYAVDALRRTLQEPYVYRKLNNRANIYSVQFSPDGQTVLLATDEEQHAVQLWNVAEGPITHSLKGFLATATSAAYSPDGTKVVIASDDLVVYVWDLRSATPSLTLTGHTDAINSVAVSANGKRIATASNDGTARIWDGITGSLLQTLSHASKTIWSAQFSPDGASLVTTGDEGSNDNINSKVRVWAVDSGQSIREFFGPPSVMQSAQFSPDGTRIVATSDDGAVLVANLTTAISDTNWLYQLKGHIDPVKSAQFSPDGTRIVTASDDGTARIWDAGTGAPIAILGEHRNSVTSADFSSDGRWIVTADRDGKVNIWDTQLPDVHALGLDKLVKLAETRLSQ